MSEHPDEFIWSGVARRLARVEQFIPAPPIWRPVGEAVRKSSVRLVSGTAFGRTRATATPRPALSPYAPRIISFKIPVDKIREVIGPGGKIIRAIVEQTGVKIDIEDDGTVAIASVDEAAAQKAMEIIGRIVEVPEVGKVYLGKVVKITDFGAFVEILPGTDGLLHISQIAKERIKRVEDVLKEGEEIMVKVIEVDKAGKIRLSRRELLREAAEKADMPAAPPAEPKPAEGEDRVHGRRPSGR